MEIKYRCRTNIDKWKMTSWPSHFAFPPRVGDYVRGVGPSSYTPWLKIHTITHCEDKYGVVCVEIELHN